MQADVWALGILLYAMLYGKMPFKAYNDKELYRRIEKGHFILPHTVSENVKNIINRMLEVNPKKRPSVKALLEDEWIAACGMFHWTAQNFIVRPTTESNSLDLEIISGIVIFKQKRFGFTEDQILKDIHNDKSQVSLLYRRIKSRGRESIERHLIMKDM
jgi:serine/threonine protein kinase